MLAMFSFSGRSHRTEMLAGTIALTVFGIALLRGLSLYVDWPAMPGRAGLPLLATLALLALPALALAARRLHDLDWPSWPLAVVAGPLLLGQALPLLAMDLGDLQRTLGGIAVIAGCPLAIVLFALPSQPQDNRFGPIPADWGLEAHALAWLETRRTELPPPVPLRPAVEPMPRASVMAELVEPLRLPDGLDDRALAIHARATRRHSAALTPHNSLARV